VGILYSIRMLSLIFMYLYSTCAAAQVPLATGPNTLAAYEAWEASVGGVPASAMPATVRAGYDEAQQAVAVRAPFEEALLPDRPADQDLLATFLAYVKLEEVGSPSLGPRLQRNPCTLSLPLSPSLSLSLSLSVSLSLSPLVPPPLSLSLCLSLSLSLSLSLYVCLPPPSHYLSHTHILSRHNKL
jgi:hypothetical protein